MSTSACARRATAASLVAFASFLFAGTGSGASAAIPSLYVDYTSACHFTMRLDSGASVGAGAPIPYGSYQVIVNTPFPFSNGQASCEFVEFKLTGPGVNYTTELGQGDGSQEVQAEVFQAGGAYTAVDTAVSPGTSIGFSATSTAATAQGGSGSTGGTSTTKSSGSTSALGTPLPSATKTVARGTLAGAISAAGKLALTFKGKAVATLKPGGYTLKVTDKSAAGGFILKGPGHGATTVTATAFKGSKTLSVNLTAGQWYFYPKAGGAKTYFFVTAS
ncbi:MAG TPA: hypothetical protein VGM80_17835 [Gaiellaceae bacterium]